MTALKLSSSHNMVAFLDKPTKSDGFEQIVDFLNTHPVKYSLTVNPAIYTSCIEQFWATAKVKTVNGEVQIQALVDKKKVIITETSGKDFFGRDTPLFPTMIVQAQEQVGKGSEIPTDSHHTPTTTQPSTSKPQKKQSRRVLDLKKTKTSQAAEITELKERVKKMEKKARTHRLRRLYKFGRSARVVPLKMKV
ncbi:hypothetical protein Tco_1297400 [Tanacetum coccineum]